MLNVSDGNEKNPIYITYEEREGTNYVKIEIGKNCTARLGNDQISFLIQQLMFIQQQRIKDLNPATRVRRKFPPLTPHLDQGS